MTPLLKRRRHTLLPLNTPFKSPLINQNKNGGFYATPSPTPKIKEKSKNVRIFVPPDINDLKTECDALRKELDTLRDTIRKMGLARKYVDKV